jgi:hypothetical protein
MAVFGTHYPKDLAASDYYSFTKLKSAPRRVLIFVQIRLMKIGAAYVTGSEERVLVPKNEFSRKTRLKFGNTVTLFNVVRTGYSCIYER